MRCYNAEVAEPITQLNFVVPDDVNDRKGTYDISEKQKATFSGLYKVYQVVNTFTDGRFTQELTMTRFNNQTGSAKAERVVLNEKDSDAKSQESIIPVAGDNPLGEGGA